MAKAVVRKRIVASGNTGGSGGGGGGESLAQTLAIGNVTGGNDIVLSDAGANVQTQAIVSAYDVDSFIAFFNGIVSSLQLLGGATTSLNLSATGVYAYANAIEFNNYAGGKLKMINADSSLYYHTDGSGYKFRITSTGLTMVGLIEALGNLETGETLIYDGRILFRNATNNKALYLKVGATVDDIEIVLPAAVPTVGALLKVASVTGSSPVTVTLDYESILEEVAETTYSGTIVWDGTAPTTLTNATYRWTRVGKMVNLRINIRYTNAGTSNTMVTLTLPSGCPTPQDPSGFSSANDYGYIGSGSLGTGPGNMGGGNTRASLGPNATATGYVLTVLAATALAAKVARISIDYYIP